MVKRRTSRLIGSLVAGVLVFGCAVACGSGFLDNLAGGVRDSGAEDTGFDAGPDGRCVLGHVPPRPEVTDSPGPPLFLALTAMRMDSLNNPDASIPPAVGLDLDQTCTCPETETCIVPDAGKHCDDDAGRDNGLSPLFSSLAPFVRDFDTDFGTGRLRDGDFNLLFSIADWNGAPNDPSIKIALFFSRGLEGKLPDGGGLRPTFDGGDKWSIDLASVVNGASHVGTDCHASARDCLPVYLDTAAYVRDGQLVAHLADAPLVISTASGIMSIELNGVTLHGRLSPEGQFDGELVGRWPADRMLNAVGRLTLKGSSDPLCKNAGVYELVKETICGSVDLATSPADDGKSKPCGALSGAVHFTASPAIAGTIRDRTAVPNECENHQDTCE